MELRSMFSNIFGREADVGPQTTTQFKLLNTYSNVFAESAPPSFANDVIVRSIVDTIARHASKLKLMHVVKGPEGHSVSSDGKQLNYNFLLNYRPNPYMSAADFLYKIASKSLMYGNAFVEIKRDEQGNAVALYPLDYASMELREVQGDLYCLFRFSNGRKATIPYADIIHLRHFYSNGEILGDSPADALSAELRLLDVCKKSLANEVKNSTSMRGYLKYDVPIKDKDKQAAVDSFNSIAAKNGVSVLDSDASYVDLSSKPVSTNNEQLSFIRDDIYRFYNVSPAIISGDFDEEQFAAFFESVIEPMAVSIGLEFTCKIFSRRQIGFGNRIVVDENRLQYSSTQHRADLVYKLLPQGIFSINEARELLNMGPCPDEAIADKYYMTLNNAAVSEISGGGDTDDEQDTE